MTAAEEGILLLCCRLGQENSKPLTLPQFRDLSRRIGQVLPEGDPFSQLCRKDLLTLGCSEEDADRILYLLNREEQLRRYLAEGDRRDIYPLTRISPGYPRRIAAFLRNNAPAVLFCKGSAALLDKPSVSLVGSREISPRNARFAASVGKMAAREGYVLVSGGAVGADRIAQNACLLHGGDVIVFTADTLVEPASEHLLYCSVDGYDLHFSTPRALYRNRLIHMQGEKTLVAQVRYGKGGTWQGSTENLKHGWSPVFVYADDSEGMQGLTERGAIAVQSIRSLRELEPVQHSMF